MKQPELRFSERRVRAGEWKINVAAAGEGAPLVFMHALGGSWRWWTPAMKALTRKYRCYAFDFPGSGKSSRLTRVPSAPEFIGALDELFEKLDIGADGQLVGHSLGAYISLAYIMLGKTHFRRVMPVAPSGVSDLRTRRSLVWGLRALAAAPAPGWLFSGAITGSYRRLLPVNRDIVAWLRSDFAKRSTRASFAFQLAHSADIAPLEAVIKGSKYVHNQDKVAVKLIWGMRDSIFSYRCGYKLTRLLPGAELTLFENSRHWPHYDEPERFLRELESFLI